MTLTEHFSFEELTRTRQVELQDANRKEARDYFDKLKLVAEMLEVIRAKFGAVRVTSGFRGPALNAATKGASVTSQHSKGEAADFVCPSVTVDGLHRWIVVESGLPFGQCILEKPPGSAWIHISLGAPYRDPKRCGESLAFDGKSYTPKKY
jgi:uncharacterized protein YcbK (DUF882 family)